MPLWIQKVIACAIIVGITLYGLGIAFQIFLAFTLRNRREARESHPLDSKEPSTLLRFVIKEHSGTTVIVGLVLGIFWSGYAWNAPTPNHASGIYCYLAAVTLLSVFYALLWSGLPVKWWRRSWVEQDLAIEQSRWIRMYPEDERPSFWRSLPLIWVFVAWFLIWAVFFGLVIAVLIWAACLQLAKLPS